MSLDTTVDTRPSVATPNASAFFSSIIGWLGVAVTGSDTSSNSLFGVLQQEAAIKAGIDPLLLTAGNSSGGVLGKMVSPQNLAIGAAAVEFLTGMIHRNERGVPVRAEDLA